MDNEQIFIEIEKMRTMSSDKFNELLDETLKECPRMDGVTLQDYGISFKGIGTDL